MRFLIEPILDLSVVYGYHGNAMRKTMLSILNAVKGIGIPRFIAGIYGLIFGTVLACSANTPHYKTAVLDPGCTTSGACPKGCVQYPNNGYVLWWNETARGCSSGTCLTITCWFQKMSDASCTNVVANGIEYHQSCEPAKNGSPPPIN